jgi:hypothetical protein
VVAKQAMHAQNRPCTHGRSLVASGLLSKNRACDLPLPRDSSHVPLPHSSPLLWSSPSSIRRLQLQVDHNAAQIHLPAPLDLIFASRSAPPSPEGEGQHPPPPAPFPAGMFPAEIQLGRGRSPGWWFAAAAAVWRPGAKGAGGGDAGSRSMKSGGAATDVLLEPPLYYCRREEL